MPKFFRRMYVLLHRARLERELEEEMSSHRDMMPQGRQQSFGSALRLREDSMNQWGWTWLDQLQQDFIYGARCLARSPGFVFSAVAVLALGIGVNLAEIHVFNAVLHRLHVRDLDSLCRFFRVSKGQIAGGFSVPEIEAYRRYNTVLSAVIAETSVPGVFLAGDPDMLPVAMVSGNFFHELGIGPVYGRLLDEQDARSGAAPVAVLGYGYWQRRFGGDPNIVGKTIRLNDKPVQVTGIAPAEFGGLAQQRTFLWMALSQHPYLINGSVHLLEDAMVQRTAMYGRLKPGVSMQAAEAQFRSLAGELRQRLPRQVVREEWITASAADATPVVGPQVILLIGTWIVLVLLILLSACANVGNMLLARGLARQREIAIRLSLGAGRWRLIRQLMTENLMLAALASIASLLVGNAAAKLLFRITNAPDMRIVTDWRIILSCAMLGLTATLAFGMAPAFQITSQLQTTRQGPKATRARRVLVAVQVAVSCVLLILSSLFTRSMTRSYDIKVTFDYQRMLAVEPAFKLHPLPPAQARRALQDMASRLRQLPGVDGAAIAFLPPLGHRSRVTHFSGQPLSWNSVDAAYFPMMQLPLLQGRMLHENEQDGLIVSESAARKLWPNDSPLGRGCTLDNRLRTVVGVVKDSGANLVSQPESVEVYTALDESDAGFASIIVHTSVNPLPLAAAIQSAAALPGLYPLVSGLQNSHLFDAMRNLVTIVGSLGAVASWLAMIGIFGLVAFTVAQRTREIGVRMALGARGADILRVVFGQFLAPLAAGIAAGVMIAAAAAKGMVNMLYGSASFDPLSYAAGLLLFLGIACAASLLPARRALRVDPASALRHE